MINTVELKNLRGIAEGKIDGLGRLAVLVGPNGCGKSTVLDALLIGASQYVGPALGLVVERRPHLDYAARWLIYRGARAGTSIASIGITKSSETVTTQLEWSEGAIDFRLRLRIREEEDEDERQYSSIAYRRTPPESEGAAVFAPDNSFVSYDGDTAGSKGIRLIDPIHGERLDELFTKISERGRRQRVCELLRPIFPDIELLELASDHGDPRLNLGFPDRSVPVVLGGEAVHVLVRVGLEIESSSEETLLIEEPEAHQHPASMRQMARALTEGARNGKQIIVTTHSLELIDALLDALADDEIDWLTLHGMRLEGGALKVGRMQGESVRRSRGEIGDELR